MSADADFCPKAVAEAVGKAGGAVVVNPGGIDPIHKVGGGVRVVVGAGAGGVSRGRALTPTAAGR